VPANLPPQYHEAEKRYRCAKSPEGKIETLEQMLSIMPKHKGTDKLRAELRSKIAKLSGEAQRKLAISRRGSGYNIKKEGAGQIVLVGLPNVGKSQLVSTVTEATTKVTDWPFTTQIPIPGMMKFENIQVQLIDMPPITDQNAKLWLSNVLSLADVLLIVVDLGDDPISQMEIITEELGKLRIKPTGKMAGGGLTQGIVQKGAIILGNKNDLQNSSQNFEELGWRYGMEFPVISISAKAGSGLEELKKRIYDILDIIRVYTKTPAGEADLKEPVVLKRGSTVEHAAESIHKDFRSKLKYAQVWGSGKFSGQKVRRDHILEDGDTIQFHV
jgi:hypothetical protein